MPHGTRISEKAPVHRPRHEFTPALRRTCTHGSHNGRRRCRRKSSDSPRSHKHGSQWHPHRRYTSSHGLFAPSVFRLVQVARLVAEKKGQDILIRALGILRKRGITNVDVTFIGDGPDRDTLQALALGQGVGTQVHFLGLMARDSIYATLHNFHAMCHPSRFEGFGLTVAEGMAAGLPLILPQGDGPWEVADRGRLCIAFPNGDVEACADAISTLINNYPAAAATARQAIGYVRRFDISATVDNYLNLYQEL